MRPFELLDSTKPGHRKILALFLVNPRHPIISTANVPCQQKAWWADEIRSIGPLGAVPTELVEQVLQVGGDTRQHIILRLVLIKLLQYPMEFPVSLEVAKEQRLDLMEERKDL